MLSRCDVYFVKVGYLLGPSLIVVDKVTTRAVMFRVDRIRIDHASAFEGLT